MKYQFLLSQEVFKINKQEIKKEIFKTIDEFQIYS